MKLDQMRRTSVDDEYRVRIRAMTVAERIRRAETLFTWSRDFLARSILAARGPMPHDSVVGSKDLC